ncbi:glutaredoxin family protein [Glaciibacter superstes]|uniref:glutaredoxin family protein n=1 Tax=Glaciibacter superstes TaxID=501023 RepID=UPI000415A5D2|nr:glutaredoxin family protein [Glaciibacter superstes]
MQTAQLTLIGKPGCHLCDDARELIHSVTSKITGHPSAPEVTFEELSILDDPTLSDLYADDIPVLLINGEVHNYWRIDPLRLRSALLDIR